MYEEPRYIRKSKRRIKGLLSMMLFLCIITLIIVAGNYVFSTTKIKITGNDQIDLRDIEGVLEVFHGKNLLRIKEKSIRSLLTEALPIENVKVSYKLPDTLNIDIIERRVAAALYHPENFILIDDSGVIVAMEKSINSLEVPVVTGLEIQEAHVAQVPTLEGRDTSYEVLLDLLGNLNHMISELSEINMETNDLDDPLFSLFTLDGFKINIGEFDLTKTAIVKEVLDDIRENFQEKGILDLRYESPVFKPFS